MTVKHDKAWRAALKKERGITAVEIEAKIMEAWDHPNILNEDVENAKLAFQRSFLLFAQSMESGNALLRELSMTEGQRAFDCGKLLHTKLMLEPLHRAHRKVVEGGKKGAQERKAKRGDSPTRDKVVSAIKGYKGNRRAMASSIAKRVGCSARYVREIIKAEPILP
jgi:hypothetical protein